MRERYTDDVNLYNMSMQLKVDREPRGFLAQRAVAPGFHGILFADCRPAADVQECVRIVRPETPQDKGTYGVATRRFAYMGYAGGKAYVQALRERGHAQGARPLIRPRI